MLMIVRAGTNRSRALHAMMIGLLLLFSVQTLAEAFTIEAVTSLSSVQAVGELEPPGDSFEAVEFSPGEDRDDFGTARPLTLTITTPVEVTQPGLRFPRLHSVPTDLFRPPMF